MTKRLIPLFILAMLFGFASAAYHVVNSAVFQRGVFKLLSKSNTSFEFTDSDGVIKFSPFTSTITVKNLKVSGRKTLNAFSFKDVTLKYSPINLLRGKLVVKHLTVDGFDASLHESAAPAEKISIKKLFVLQNLVLEDASIQNSHFILSEGTTLSADTLHLKFVPRLSGRVDLSINLQGLNLKTAEDSTSLAGFSLEGKTFVTDWFDYPPYVNSLDGQIAIQDLRTEKLDISKIASKVRIKNQKISLSDFEVIKDSKPVKGTFEVDLTDNSFKADVSIAEPIELPTFGSDNPTIDTGGLISGNIHAEGKGLSLTDSTGSAKLNLTHEKTGLPAITISSNPSWKNGVITVNGTNVTVDEGDLSVTGTVNIPAKKIELKCTGKGIPLQGVFGRFGDDEFHPIFGVAIATAEITGWGKSFHVTGKAETTAPGGYYKIVTDKAIATVDATYNELNLNGEIQQEGKKTGDISLKIKYGTKAPGQPRPKDLTIIANIFDNNLGKSFAEYDLSGTGNGHLEIHGPQRNYKGKISATIVGGSFLGINFQKVSALADMAYRKITFTSGEFELPNIEKFAMISPLNMDFDGQGFRFHGTPIENVSIDASHRSHDNSWNIKNIKYHDLTLIGTYSPAGSSNLQIAGTFDTSILSMFKEYFREVEGPAEARLKITGPSASPQASGSITFNNNLIYPRAFNSRMENVEGELKFSGHSIESSGITGTVEDGRFNIKGNIQLAGKKVESVNLNLEGQNLRYSSPDRTFKLELSPNITWKGTGQSSVLSGDVMILDGRYTKDFNILQGLVGGSKKTEATKFKGSDNVRLNLTVRNSGDLAIRNNVGDIWLTADTLITGTTAKPHITGAVETTEGKIHYLGRDFVITKGYVEFRGPYTNPYLEISATYEVPTLPDMVITATLQGNVDNLTLDLTSTKSMERKDIISTLMSGTYEETGQSQWSAGLGPQVLASQLTSMIERPITKLTHLDIFRLEAAEPAGTTTRTSSSLSPQISKIHIGKQVSDRLTFEMNTDINVENAQQMLRAEYLLTDFLLLLGEGTTNSKYTFGLSLRFRER